MVVNPFPWTEDESYTVGATTYTVHPLAKLFPLIFGDEFERLVDDMRAHGLRQPVLVTGETMIVDGRNRLRAALAADVPPVFETLPPDANLFSVIVSENVLRRQMNKGQFAMVAALTRQTLTRQTRPASADRGHVRLPLGDPALTDTVETAGQEGGTDVGGHVSWAMARLPTQEELAACLSVSVAYVRNAERVLESDPDLALQVFRGELALSKAYELCKPPAQPVGGVGRSSEAATGLGITERNVQRGTSDEPSGSRNTAVVDSTSRDENPQDTQAPATAGKNAPHPMPVPAADGSAQPAPSVAAATKPRPDEAGHSAESMVPRVVLEGVRLILGDVDLDPCSSEAAQKRVAAGEGDPGAQVGLSRPWGGNVFVYPPAGRVDAFAQKLTAEMVRGNVQRAAFLGPADLRPDWAVRLLQAPTFRALVIERDDRSVEAASDRTRGDGRLALFLLGVDNDRLPHVLDTWGMTVFSALPHANRGGEANAARVQTEDPAPHADSSTMSTVKPSAPAHSKSGGKALGSTGTAAAKSTSEKTGNRVVRAGQPQAPSAPSEEHRRGIGAGIAAALGMDPDEVLSSEAWVEKAKGLRFFGGTRRRVTPRPDDHGAHHEPGRASRAADGRSEAATGGASNGEE